MKRVIKIIIAIICWVIGLYLLYETICSFEGLDPWGLSFAFGTLPIGIIAILFLVEAIILTKELVKK